MNNLKSQQQQEIAFELNKIFGIKPERILFLNPRDSNEPWIPADELESIARQVGGFTDITVVHDKFVTETNQVVYTATVINKTGVSFTRSGVATVGERPNDEDIDADTLASGRALGAALRAAGFHPYRSGSVVDFAEMREQIETRKFNAENQQIEDAARQRTNDLKAIHAEAEKKGLIVGKDDTLYRMWLFENFRVKTAAILDAETRARVINKLKNYRDEFAELEPALREDAMIA
jgi:hypothetical protein